MKKAIIFLTLFSIVAFAQQKESFTDSRDKKAYKIVKIGSQTWMAENLNYDTEGSKCYDNDLANCDKYGRLYDWETAMKACPKGWHLPSEAEWKTLFDFARGYKIAGKMQAVGTITKESLAMVRTFMVFPPCREVAVIPMILSTV